MVISGNITTGMLEEICKAINAEYGQDCPVCIQFREDGTLIEADYAMYAHCNMNNGTLYLINEPFDKEESK